CPRCANPVMVPAAAGNGGAPRPVVPEVVDMPAAQRRPAPQAEASYEEVEERYEEDRGRPRRRGERAPEDDYDDRDRPRRRRGRPDEDYDDDRDRPRRRGRDAEDDLEMDRPRKKGGMSQRKKWEFVSLGVFIVAIASCVIGGGMAIMLIADLL